MFVTLTEIGTPENRTATQELMRWSEGADFPVKRGKTPAKKTKACPSEWDILRTITRASLFEISAVTVPAYPQAQIEARAWEAHQDRQPYRGSF